MVRKLCLAAVAVLLLATGLLIWQVLDHNGVDVDLSGKGNDLSQATGDRYGPTSEVSLASSGVAEQDEESIIHGGSPATREHLEPEGHLFAGRVVDAESSEPITAYHFKLTRSEPHRRDVTLFEGEIRDPEGRFSFRLMKNGYHGYQVRTHDHLCRAFWVEVPVEEGLDDYLVELDRGERVSGRVVDDATSAPIEGAVVGLARKGRDIRLERKLAGRSNRFEPTSLKRLRLGSRLETIHAISDAAGHFSLDGLLPMEIWIAAAHPDFAERACAVTPGSVESVEIRLKRGFHVFGKVRDDHGRPAEGIVVLVWGAGTPISRITLTSRDGTYRTAPVAPGEITASAQTSDDGTPASTEFTAEWKTASISDADLELDFGPLLEYVKLQGTVIDYGGVPLPQCYLSLRLDERYGETNSVNKLPSASSDAQGRFVIRKLVPGSYRVLVGPGGQRPYVWGEIDFTEAGSQERKIDLRKTGGAISGSVVDTASGAPPEGDSLGVSIFAQRMEKLTSGDSLQAPVQNDGSFCLRGLPAGEYMVMAQGGGCLSEPQLNIQVRDGKITDGLRFAVTFCGDLILTFAGISTGERAKLEGEFDSGQSLPFPLKLNEPPENRHTLPSGEWQVKLSAKSLGRCCKSFSIEPHKTTHLTVYRGDFATEERGISVIGWIDGPIGVPVKYSWIEANSADRMSEDKVQRKAKTDGEGRFTFEDLAPGRWSFTLGSWKKDYALDLGDVEIPAEASDPYPIRLFVPDSTVEGVLCDAERGHPITCRNIRWRAVVYPGSGLNWRRLALFAGDDPTQFLLRGLAQGSYRIWLECEGFEEHIIDPLDVPQGTPLDLGEIRLVPTGLLDLEAVGPDGEPLEWVRLHCGKERYSKRSGPDLRFELGKFRFSGLPTGRMTVHINANGCREKETEVFLIPGEPVLLRVHLDAK